MESLYNSSMTPNDLRTILDAIGKPPHPIWIDYWTFVVLLVSAVLSAATVGLLYWYALETKRLRIAARDQIIEAGKLLQESQKQNQKAQEQAATNADLLKES